MEIAEITIIAILAFFIFVLVVSAAKLKMFMRFYRIILWTNLGSWFVYICVMSRLKLHDTTLSSGEIIHLREQKYLQLSPAEKLNTLFNLIAVSKKLNGNKPLKQPQGKGIIISRNLQLPDATK